MCLILTKFQYAAYVTQMLYVYVYALVYAYINICEYELILLYVMSINGISRIMCVKDTGLM